MFLAFHILIFTETTSAKLPKKIEPNFAGMVWEEDISIYTNEVDPIICYLA